MLTHPRDLVRRFVLLAACVGCAPIAAAQMQGCQPTWLPTFGTSLSGAVMDTARFDDGTGPALYVCATMAGGVRKWDGAGWATLGGGVAGTPNCMAVFDDGSGPALYVGGFNVMRWNGTSWSSVGQSGPSEARSMIVFDDGSGPALFVGSWGGPAISKWDGTNWTHPGGGMQSPGSYIPQVLALEVFDDGSGPRLAAGGSFQTAGATPAANIASWDGSQWSAIGTGLDGLVRSLASFQLGGATALYAGGVFLTPAPANRLVAWNGTSWSTLGSDQIFDIYSIAGFDDGNSSAMYVCGFYLHPTLGNVLSLRRWNGSSWSDVWGWVQGRLLSLAVHDFGPGPALYVGGGMLSPSGDLNVARWGNPAGCGSPGVVVCEPGIGGVLACPCGNPPAGLGRGCDNSAATGGAKLAATGIARLAYDSVVFTTVGEMPSATSIVLQGDAPSAGGLVFGQGVRCVAGTLRRLYVKSASAGSISAPEATDLDVHVRSAALGDVIAPGTHRFYGVYYRDPNVLGACPSANTFNVTQQLDVLWSN